MIRYKLTNEIGDEIEISLDSDDQNVAATPEFEGEEYAIAEVQAWLRQQSGAYGHVITEEITPTDLAFALSTLDAVERYQPEILEGEDLVNEFDPNISEDSFT